MQQNNFSVNQQMKKPTHYGTQGVSKRDLQRRNLIKIYLGDMYSVLNCHNLAKPSRFYLGQPRFNAIPLAMQGVSKSVLHWYFKCYCVASVTRSFMFNGVQTIHLSTT
jgi:hypothetical protein